MNFLCKAIKSFHYFNSLTLSNIGKNDWRDNYLTIFSMKQSNKNRGKIAEGLTTNSRSNFSFETDFVTILPIILE